MADTPARKLAVILHADVVGSTSLVQKDESLAHQRIRKAFLRLSTTAGDYGGVAHEIRGDALVAEFSRASDAVCAALAFQTGNTECNAEFDDDIRPEIRVGISLGEVVVADGTVTGAGVVLAQRLEQLATPGGIVVQGSVAETVPSRMPFAYDDLGAKTLKGFDQQIRGFSVALKSGYDIPVPERMSSDNPEGLRSLDSRPKQTEGISIAVLPFESAKEPEFAEGLSNDLITDLGKFGRFIVAAPHSTLVYKAQATSIQQVATELSVDYVLEGRVQWANGRVRVSVQLGDGARGEQIWAVRYQREVDDIFDLQDELIEMISASVAHKLDSIEATRTTLGHVGNSVRDLYARGREIFFARTEQSNAEAIQLLTEAIELDKNFARAYGFLAWLYIHEVRYGWTENPNQSQALALEFALRALSLDPTDYESHWRLAVVYLHQKQFDRAVLQYEKAKQLNPNHAGFLSEMAGALIAVGRVEDAISQVKRAMKLNTHYPDHFVAHLGWAFYEAERYDESSRILQEMNNPPAVFLPIVIATQVRLGFLDEAQSVVAELMGREPKFVSSKTHFGPYRDVAREQRLIADIQSVIFPD